MPTGDTRQEGLFVQTGNPFTVDESTPFAPGQLGKIENVGGNTTGIDVGLGAKVVQYIKRHASDTVTVAAGDLAFWSDTDNYLVTGDLAQAIGGTARPLVAGVFGAATPSAGNYGFIQIGGIAPLRVSDSTSASTTSAGVNLIWSTNRQLKKRTATDITTWLAEMHQPLIATLSAGNNSTGTNLLVEGILQLGRFVW